MPSHCPFLKLFYLLAVIAGAALLAIGGPAPAHVTDEAQLFGDWRGESICQVKDSPCHDERVVYHISKGKERGTIVVSADKIVDGKPVNMGSGDYQYEERTGTLTNETSGRVWKLVIKGNSLEGTLTLANKTVYRRLMLKKET
jgi:hypothetical protein